MFRWIPLGLLVFLPAALPAQEGTIAYRHSVRMEVPPEMRARIEARGGAGRAPGGPSPFDRVSEVVLIFNEFESLMKPVPPAQQARGRPEGPPGMGDRRRGMAARMRMSSTARRDRETIVEAYARYDDGTLVETREFLGRTFLLEDRRPEFRWRLTGD